VIAPRVKNRWCCSVCRSKMRRRLALR
jgi:hypothetical protein